MSLKDLFIFMSKAARTKRSKEKLQATENKKKAKMELENQLLMERVAMNEAYFQKAKEGLLEGKKIMARFTIQDSRSDIPKTLRAKVQGDDARTIRDMKEFLMDIIVVQRAKLELFLVV